MEFWIERSDVEATRTKDRGGIAAWAERYAPCKIRIGGDGVPQGLDEIVVNEGESMSGIFDRLNGIVSMIEEARKREGKADE